MANLMTQPTRSGRDLFKLVDRCTRCALTFKAAADFIVNERFRDLSVALQETLDRFRYELQSEIRRIEGKQSDPPKPCTETYQDLDSLRKQCNAVLGETLQEYETIRLGHLPAHARAMVQRQTRILRQFGIEFSQFSCEVGARAL